ncbi:MAG TPA: hypothetical protein PLO62_09215 [Candidatus Hydrogenedentes bacterium]|nr:hypothetical protein [Candidatus Hydrogenedentota bacterium]HOS03932.1 hypothetical protein [Candidatus Hydrogenedentota bacterium]
MALAECPRCKKLFEKAKNPVCPKCQADEEADYESVREALAETPNQTAEQVAETAGVNLDCVLRLLADGRIQSMKASEQVRCGRCGAPAISISKKLCEACLQKLNAEIAALQSKAKLPPQKPKKSLSLGNALDIRSRIQVKREGQSDT